MLNANVLMCSVGKLGCFDRKSGRWLYKYILCWSCAAARDATHDQRTCSSIFGNSLQIGQMYSLITFLLLKLSKVGKASQQALQMNIFTLLGTLIFQIDLHTSLCKFQLEDSPASLVSNSLWIKYALLTEKTPFFVQFQTSLSSLLPRLIGMDLMI